MVLGTDDNWGTAANWGGTAPVAGNSLTFGGITRLATINNLAADTGIAGITFASDAGEFVLSGNRITLGGNITQSDNSLQTINLDMILSATRTFTQSSAATSTIGNIVVNGVMSGAGGLIKSGANTSNSALYNTLTLTAANTYTGTTTVASGSLILSGVNGSIASSSAIFVDNGSSFGGPVSIGGRLWLDNTAGNANRIGDTVPVTLRALGQLQLTGNASADTTETIGQVTLGGGTAGGRGIITLDGTAAGRLHTLAAAGLTRTNTSTALIRGTNLGQAATNATRITLASTSGLTFVGTSTASGVTPGTAKDVRIIPYMIGDITATGNGSSFVTYDSVGGLRPLAASEYTVLTAGYTSAVNPENVTAFSGTLTNANPTVNSLRFAGAATLSGTGTLTIASGALANLSSGAAVISGFSGITLGDGTWNEGIITAQGNSLTINVPINVTGGGGITKAGGNDVVFAAANTYTGDTNIHQGMLVAAHNNALGSTSGRTIINGPDGGILGLRGNITLAEPLTLIGENGGFGAILRNIADTNTLTGLITVSGNTRISATAGTMNITGGIASVTSTQIVINSSTTINFSGQPIVLGSGGTFYMDSAGLTTLSSTGHFWGATRVGAGSVGTNLRLFGENILPERSELYLGFSYATNGGVDLNGFNQTVGSLTTGTSLAGTRVITSATPATLTVNQSATTSYDGSFGGQVSFVKLGTGLLTLMGTNTSTGTTAVNNGTLILDYTATNTTKLADGAALTLGSATLQLDRTTTPTGSHVETVASTSLQGAANITRPGAASTASIQLNSITRQPGTTLNIQVTGSATTDNLNNAAGMLGTWATVGGSHWAVNSTNADDGAITAFSGYTTINRLGASAVPNTPAAHVRIIDGGTSGNITLGATVTDVSTLSMAATVGSATIDPATGETLRLGAEGGILHATGAGALLIGTAANDGILTAGGAPDTAGEIMVQRWATNDLTINSTIANNGTGIVSVSIGGSTGSGMTRLNGTNTYTGRTVVNGRLGIDAETALGANPAAFAADQLTLNGGTIVSSTAFTMDDTNRGITLGASGGTLEATSAANVLAMSVAVPITGSGQLNKAGAGDAQLSVANSYTGHTYVNAGRLIIRDPGALGSTAAGTTIASGAALRLEGAGMTLAEPLNIIGQGTGSAGGLQSNTTGNSTVSGAITLPVSGGSRITVTNTGRLFVTGGLRGPAAATSDALIVVGAVTFSDKPVLMYSGRLELVAGTGSPVISVAGNTYGVLNVAWGASSQVTVNDAMNPTGALELGYHTTFSGSSPNTTFSLNATQQTAAELRTGAVSIGSGGYTTPTRILTGTAGSTLTLNQTTNSLFDGGIQGALSLIKNGSGTLSLQANSTTTGDTVLNAGAIELRNAASTVQGGTIGTSAGSTGNFTTVITGLTNATTTLLVGQPITGAGIPAGSFIASIDSNSQVTIRSTVAATAGAISATFGVVPGALTNSTLDYQGGALTFGVTTASTTLGGIKGSRSLNLTNTNGGAVALTVGGNNQSTVYTGAISGNGSLIKTGTGTLEVTGDSVHTGGVTVSNGVLLVNNINGSGTGLGNVSVASGATLGGNGSIGVSTSTANITVNAGGTLQVGNTHNLPSGSAASLDLATSGPGTISLSGTVQFDIFARSAGVNSLANNDVIRFIADNTVNFAGTLEVINSTGSSTSSWVEGDSWQLFDWSLVSPPVNASGSFTYNLPTLNSGLFWDTSSLFTTGFITVMVPEPGRACLLTVGLLGFALRRRRRVG